MNCSVCIKPIGSREVRVHFDHTGCEGVVDVQPSHIACYLQTYDPGLDSNAAIVQHVKHRAADALNHGWDHPAMTER